MASFEVIAVSIVSVLPFVAIGAGVVLVRLKTWSLRRMVNSIVEENLATLLELGVTNVRFRVGRMGALEDRGVELVFVTGQVRFVHLHLLSRETIQERIFSAARMLDLFERFAEEMRRAAGEKPASSWWDVLSVGPQASKAEINAAWRRLARSAHPDIGGSLARMTELNVARDTGLAAVR